MKELLTHMFASDTANLEPVRGLVRGTLGTSGYPSEFIETCVLAVDEAVSNVMRHGYRDMDDGSLTLSIGIDGNELVFAVQDLAAPFDGQASGRSDTEALRAGGYGRILIQEIMDSVHYGRTGDGTGNLLEMRRQIPPPEQ